MQNNYQYAVIYPPNRPMEEITVQPNNPHIDGFLFSINFNKRGELVLGKSDVCGTGWYGAVTHYKSFKQVSNSDYYSYYVTDSTVGDVVFYDNNCLLVIDDTKFLKLLSLPEDDRNSVMAVKDTFETESIIEDVAVWNDNSKIVICSDTSILTLELNSNSAFTLLNTFKNYHTERVTSVDVDKSQLNTFVSSSADRKVCLWDDRTPDFASVLYQNEFSAMKTVCCHPLHSNIVTAGSDAGDIYLLDKREPKQFVTVYNCFDNSIHRMTFDDSNKLAVCGDTKDLLVLNCSESNLKPLYISQEHEDIVRGLAWYEGELFSCGYDGTCLKHLV